MKLEWHFPLLGGGDAQGIHNPGIETFRPFLPGLVREMGQNTLDAPDGLDQPVMLLFQREDVSRSDIPGLGDLATRLAMCRKFWDHEDPNKRDQDALDFFDNALMLIKKRSIPCLRVSDYNTTGVAGDDSDRSSGWHKLAKSSGTTSKTFSSGAGGSFGMGKMAALGASQFRTVYYSTLTTNDEHRFIGSSLLTAHADVDGTEYQHKWYFGQPGGGTVSAKNAIPPMFLRKKVGLDTFVTAFDFTENWEEDIAVAVLESFWPAIMWGKMEVWIGQGKNEIVIDKLCLGQLLAKYSHRSEAHIYHTAYVTGIKHTACPKRLGECSAYVISGANLPKKFAMIRRNGMIIEKRAFSSRLSVAGVFECVNDVGNGLLRQMEPPCHSRWDPDLAPPNGSKIEQEFKRVIYDAIKEANSVNNVETGSVTGLEDLLPFDDPANRRNSSLSKRPTEGLNEKPKQTSSSATIPRGSSSRKRKKKGVHVVIPIIPRAIKTAPGQYRLKIEHDGRAENCYVSVSIAGDMAAKAHSQKVGIRSAIDGSGSPVKFEENVFGPVTLDLNSSFDIRLACKRRIALEVSAYHEA